MKSHANLSKAKPFGKQTAIHPVRPDVSTTKLEKDPYQVQNKGLCVSRQRFERAIRNSVNFASIARDLRAGPSGPFNNWVRENAKDFGLNTLHWDTPITAPRSPEPYFQDIEVTQKERECPDCRQYKSPAASFCTRCLPNHLNKDQKPKREFDYEKMEQSVRLWFEAIGDDPNRAGIKDTPKRVAKMWADTMNGYFLNPKDFVTEFDNESNYTGHVTLKDAEFYTICEHHLLPFSGVLDIAYKPKNKIVGLSKLVRIARVYAKRPQVQEALTQQITDALFDVLEPHWVAVKIDAEHYCMKLRGVRINGSHTITYKERVAAGLHKVPQNVFSI